jgi:hypothetical protein
MLAIMKFSVLKHLSITAGLIITLFVSNWELSLTIFDTDTTIRLNGWNQMKFIQGITADAKA